MSLIPMMKLRLAAPEQLVDLGRLPDLNYIREEGGELHIGAMTTHYEMESSALLRAQVPAAGGSGSAHRRHRRSATWGPSAEARRTPIRRPIIPPHCAPWKPN